MKNLDFKFLKNGRLYVGPFIAMILFSFATLLWAGQWNSSEPFQKQNDCAFACGNSNNMCVGSICSDSQGGGKVTQVSTSSCTQSQSGGYTYTFFCDGSASLNAAGAPQPIKTKPPKSSINP